MGSTKDSLVVCNCYDMKYGSIDKLIARKKVTTVEEVMRSLRIGNACGCCRVAIQMMLKSHHKLSE